MSASERVDLFVIDAQNKFVLLLENKAGAAHSQAQLDQYRESFSRVVAGNPRLRDYAHAYIALDREFDEESATLRPAANAWLHLGYDWLKISASRALMHVERGNAAARLVVSYCNRQTDWESPDDEKCLELAAALHQSHPDAVKTLISLSRGRAEREWLKNTKGEDAYSLFLLQNQGAVALLRETQGMASVRSALLVKLPSFDRANIRHKRAWLDMCPTGWQVFEGAVWWPVFLNVSYTDANRTKFSLALCWNLNNASTESQGQQLRGLLTTVEPQFKKHPDSRWRRVVLARGLSLSELCSQMTDMDARLSKALPAQPAQ